MFKYKTLSSPISVQWEVTSNCDSKCMHCYNYWQADKKGNENKESTRTKNKIYKRVTDEIINSSVFSVTVTGGDPLIKYDDIEEFIIKLTSHNITVSINSTLSQLTKGKAKRLYDAGVRSFLVSFPSFNKEIHKKITNNSKLWEQTQQGIIIALRQGFSLTINMVVSKVNINQIYDTAQFLKRLGVKRFSATKVSQPSQANDFDRYLLDKADFEFMANQLLRVKNDLGMHVDSIEAYPRCSFSNRKIRNEIEGLNRNCGAGKTFCVIGENGSIRPCILVEDEYGNITKGHNLKTAWLAMDYWRSDKLLPSECFPCKYRAICGGGCKAEAKHVYGDYKALDPYAIPGNIDNAKKKHKRISTYPEEFYFNNKMRFRPEDFGGILFINNRDWVPVNEELYDFTVHSKGKRLTPKILSNVLKCNSKELKDTLSILWRKAILVHHSNN